MFPGGRERLWNEKLGLIPRFTGNAATRWGTNQEEQALARSASSLFETYSSGIFADSTLYMNASTDS